jgi:acetyl-CoA acyltransferase
MTTEAFICDAIRTPFGRYGGALASLRPDDLGAIPIRALMLRNPQVDWAALDDVVFGCANQAGEDNRNVARMSLLLAGLPPEVPGATLNRLCGSGMDAVGSAARAIKSGEVQLMLAGGVESMSRAPFVMPKADSGLQPHERGLRHHHRLALRQPAHEGVVRRGLDARDGRKRRHRLRDRARGAGPHGPAQPAQRPAGAAGRLAGGRDHAGEHRAEKGEPLVVDRDEHPRETSLEALARLQGVVRPDGTVTAGNASGVNDGACALLLASAAAAAHHGLTPRARVVAMATTGLAPRIMGLGPAPATRKLLAMTGLTLAQMDVIELNEAFAAQGLAVLRDLGLADDDPRVNRWGGAIALGHPLGASGARLITTAVNQLHHGGGRYALCTMCIGVGQGIAMVVERV